MINKRLISLLTCAFFALNQFYGIGSAWSAQTSFPVSEINTPKAFSIRLPSGLGSIESLHAGKESSIVHIQTAHGNYEAQKNIQAILTHLEDAYDFDLLFLEGGMSELDAERIRFFPEDMDLTRQVTEALTQKSLLTGAELFLLESSRTQGYGIEDTRAYRENGKAFMSVLKQQKKSKAFLNQLDGQIERLTAPHLSQNLRSFLRTLEKFENKTLSFDHWLDYLSRKAKEFLGVDLNAPGWQLDYPMLYRLTKLRMLEKNLDRAVLENERKEFIKELRSYSSSSYEAVKAVLEQELGTHQLSGPETGLLFEGMVASLPRNFNYEAFPNVNRFIAYLILQSELDGEALMTEMEELTFEISNRLAETEEAKQVVALLENYRLLQKLFRLEMTPHDYAAIPSTLPSKLVEQLLELNKEERVRDTEFKNLEQVDLLFQKAMAFYQGAGERDVHMLANIEKRLKEMGKKKAIVVTGGFHAKPFEKHFKKADFNYALISPTIKAIDEGDRKDYLNAVFKKGLPALKESTFEPLLAVEPSSNLATLTQTPIFQQLVKERSELRVASEPLKDDEALDAKGQKQPKQKKQKRKLDGVVTRRLDYLNFVLLQKDPPQGGQWTLEDLALETAHSKESVYADLVKLNLLESEKLNLEIERIGSLNARPVFPRPAYAKPIPESVSELLARARASNEPVSGNYVFKQLLKASQKDKALADAMVFAFFTFAGEPVPEKIVRRISKQTQQFVAEIQAYLEWAEARALRQAGELDDSSSFFELEPMQVKVEREMYRFERVRFRAYRNASMETAEKIMESRPVAGGIELTLEEEFELLRALLTKKFPEEKRRKIYEYFIEKNMHVARGWVHGHHRWIRAKFDANEVEQGIRMAFKRSIEKFVPKEKLPFFAYAKMNILFIFQREAKLREKARSGRGGIDEEFDEIEEYSRKDSGVSASSGMERLLTYFNFLGAKEGLLLGYAYGVSSLPQLDDSQIALRLDLTEKEVADLKVEAIEKLKGVIVEEESAIESESSKLFLHGVMDVALDHPIAEALQELDQEKLGKIYRILSQPVQANSDYLAHLLNADAQHALHPNEYFLARPQGTFAKNLADDKYILNHGSFQGVDGKRRRLDTNHSQKSSHVEFAFFTTRQIREMYPYTKYLLPAEEQLILVSRDNHGKVWYHALSRDTPNGVIRLKITQKDFTVWLSQNERFKDPEIIAFLKQLPNDKRISYSDVTSKRHQFHGESEDRKREFRLSTRPGERYHFSLMSRTDILKKYPDAVEILPEGEQMFFIASSKDREYDRYFQFPEEGPLIQPILNLFTKTGEIRYPKNQRAFGSKKEILEFWEAGIFDDASKRPMTRDRDMTQADERGAIPFGSVEQEGKLKYIMATISDLRAGTALHYEPFYFEQPSSAFPKQWILVFEDRKDYIKSKPLNARYIKQFVATGGNGTANLNLEPNHYLVAFAKRGIFNDVFKPPFLGSSFVHAAGKNGRINFGDYYINKKVTRVTKVLSKLPAGHLVRVRKIFNEGRWLLAIDTQHEAYQNQTFYFEFGEGGALVQMKSFDADPGIDESPSRGLNFNEIFEAQQLLMTDYLTGKASLNVWLSVEDIAKKLDVSQEHLQKELTRMDYPRADENGAVDMTKVAYPVSTQSNDQALQEDRHELRAPVAEDFDIEVEVANALLSYDAKTFKYYRERTLARGIENRVPLKIQRQFLEALLSAYGEKVTNPRSVKADEAKVMDELSAKDKLILVGNMNAPHTQTFGVGFINANANFGKADILGAHALLEAQKHKVLVVVLPTENLEKVQALQKIAAELTDRLVLVSSVDSYAETVQAILSGARREFSDPSILNKLQSMSRKLSKAATVPRVATLGTRLQNYVSVFGVDSLSVSSGEVSLLAESNLQLIDQLGSDFLAAASITLQTAGILANEELNETLAEALDKQLSDDARSTLAFSSRAGNVAHFKANQSFLDAVSRLRDIAQTLATAA